MLPSWREVEPLRWRGLGVVVALGVAAPTLTVLGSAMFERNAFLLLLVAVLVAALGVGFAGGLVSLATALLVALELMVGEGRLLGAGPRGLARLGAFVLFGLVIVVLSEMLRTALRRAAVRERALRGRNFRLAELMDAQRGISAAALELDTLGRQAMDAVSRLTSMAGAALVVIDDARVRCVGAAGSAAALQGREAQSPALAWLHHARVVRRDLRHAAPADALLLLARLGIAPDVPVVLLPLVFDARPVGVLVAVGAAGEGGATEDDAQALEALVAVLAATLCHALEFEARRTLVAERTRALEAARQSEGAYRSLIDGLPDMVYVLDLDGRFVDANPAAYAGSGHAPGTLVGLHPRDLTHPAHQDPERTSEHLARAAAGEAVRFEWWARGGDGTPFPNEVVIRRSTYRGRPVLLAVARDISDRLHAEAELREREIQLRQSQKMEAIGRLAGGVAHDFNNLLTVISCHGELLADALPAGDATLEDVSAIRAAAERAAALTRQLLAFSRRQVLQPRLHALDEVIGSLQVMLRRLVAEDIVLVTRLDAPGAVVRVDRGQLEQLVMNLVVNARDAMPGGGTLTIATSATGARASLLVRDTGIGMDATVRARIFEPFFTTKPAGQGTGLGLSTVYGIVEQSGGAIDVHSAPGAGAAFRVTLPLAAGVPDEAPARAGSPPAGGAETILLVEDEDAVRALARRVLAGRGYRVIEARDGLEALELADRHGDAIDLVLSDVVMPRLGGAALAAALAARGVRAPVLLMSGYTDDEIVRRGALLDGPALLQKPFTAEGLLRAVRERLGR